MVLYGRSALEWCERAIRDTRAKLSRLEIQRKEILGNLAPYPHEPERWEECLFQTCNHQNPKATDVSRLV